MNRLFFSPAYIISHTILEGQILCYRVCVSFRVSGKSLPVLPYHLRNSSKKKKTKTALSICHLVQQVALFEVSFPVCISRSKLHYFLGPARLAAPQTDASICTLFHGLVDGP